MNRVLMVLMLVLSPILTMYGDNASPKYLFRVDTSIGCYSYEEDIQTQLFGWDDGGTHHAGFFDTEMDRLKKDTSTDPLVQEANQFLIERLQKIKDFFTHLPRTDLHPVQGPPQCAVSWTTLDEGTATEAMMTTLQSLYTYFFVMPPQPGLDQGTQTILYNLDVSEGTAPPLYGALSHRDQWDQFMDTVQGSVINGICPQVDPGSGTLQSAIDQAKQTGGTCLRLKDLGVYTSTDKAGKIIKITDQVLTIRSLTLPEPTLPSSLLPITINPAIKAGITISWSQDFARQTKLKDTVSVIGITLSDPDLTLKGSPAVETETGVSVTDYSRVALTDVLVQSDGSGFTTGIVGKNFSTLTLDHSLVFSTQGPDILGNATWGLSVGIDVQDSSTLTLNSSEIEGVQVLGMGKGIQSSTQSTVTVVNSTVAHNDTGLLIVKGSVALTGSTITDNGTDSVCYASWPVCGGVGALGSVKVSFAGVNYVENNSRWGVFTELKKCGFSGDDFSGSVNIDPKTVIKDNKPIGPDARDGDDLCLPDQK